MKKSYLSEKAGGHGTELHRKMADRGENLVGRAERDLQVGGESRNALAKVGHGMAMREVDDHHDKLADPRTDDPVNLLSHQRTAHLAVDWGQQGG